MLELAYRTLINEQQREKYERYGKDAFKDIKEITSKNPYSGKDSRKGPSMRIKLPVSIEDLYNGTTVKAQFQTKQACSKCMGTGAESPKKLKKCNACSAKGFQLVDGADAYGQPRKFQATCPHCQGFGKNILKACGECGGKRIIDTIKTVDINIPAGFNQKEMKLKNYGSQQNLGAPSDFIVQIQEIPSQQWRKNGDTLFYTMTISFEESIFGFSKPITHLNGEQILIERTEITTKNDKVHFQGKGFNNKGRLTVQFKIQMPTFTDRQLDMWQEFFEKYKNL